MGVGWSGGGRRSLFGVSSQYIAIHLLVGYYVAFFRLVW